MHDQSPDPSNPPGIRQLNGSTRVPRLHAVALVREAILGAHGWVTGFHEFSNISICIEFELPASNLPSLAQSLIAAGITLNARTEQRLQSLEDPQPAESVCCTLQILFIHDEPDMRRTVLAVPG